MDENTLLIAAYEKRCRVLGPGERYCIWTQGCFRSCTGCIAESMKSFDEGCVILTRELLDDILHTEGIEGITVSGGEPFLQAEELSKLFFDIKNKSDLGIIVYTGYNYEELEALEKRHKEIGKMLDCIDLLIDGPYEESLNYNYGLKGSVNQGTINFTDRYIDCMDLYHNPKTPRLTEIYLSEKGTFLAGVPSKNMEKSWKNFKNKENNNGNRDISEKL